MLTVLELVEMALDGDAFNCPLGGEGHLVTEVLSLPFLAFDDCPLSLEKLVHEVGEFQTDVSVGPKSKIDFELAVELGCLIQSVEFKNEPGLTSELKLSIGKFLVAFHSANNEFNFGSERVDD